MPILKSSSEEISSYIDEFSARTADGISYKLKKELQLIYEDHIAELKRQLLISDNVEFLKLQTITVDSEAFTEMLLTDRDIPYSLEKAIKELPNEASEFLHDSLTSLDSVSKRLGDRIKTNSFVKMSKITVEKSIGQIRSMLDGFIDSVRLYRSAILAMNARQLAEEAGIVKMIEELEKSEIPIEKKEVWLSEIVSKVFPSWMEIVDNQESEIQHLTIRLNNVKRALTEYKSNNSVKSVHLNRKLLPNMDWLKKNTIIAREIANTVDDFRILNQTFFSDIDALCEQTMEEENEKFIIDKRRIRDIRKRRFKKYLYLPIVLISVVTFLFYLSQVTPPENWAVPVITNFLSAFLLFLLSFAWDRSKAQIEERKKQHVKKRHDVLESLIDSKSTQFNWLFIDELKQVIESEVSKNIRDSTAVFIHKNISELFGDQYKNLNELSSQLNEISKDYGSAAQEITARITEYYMRTDINLGVLAKVSSVIRQEEIEPSFETLNERNVELLSKKNELIALN